MYKQEGNHYIFDDVIYIPTLVDPETREEVFDKIAQHISDTGVIVETGSYLGGSICHLAQRIKQNKKHCLIYAVDKWICDDISSQSNAFAGNPTDYYLAFLDNCKLTDTENIIPVKKDSIEASKDFQDKSIDFLFLDSCHNYPYTKNEILAWLRKMKDNSILCGHDFVGGIYQAVIEVFGQNYQTTSNRASYIIKLGDGLC